MLFTGGKEEGSREGGCREGGSKRELSSSSESGKGWREAAARDARFDLSLSVFYEINFLYLDKEKRDQRGDTSKIGG